MNIPWVNELSVGPPDFGVSQHGASQKTKGKLTYLKIIFIRCFVMRERVFVLKMIFLAATKKRNRFFLNNIQHKGYVNILEIMNEEIRKFIYKSIYFMQENK